MSGATQSWNLRTSASTEAVASSALAAIAWVAAPDALDAALIADLAKSILVSLVQKQKKKVHEQARRKESKLGAGGTGHSLSCGSCRHGAQAREKGV